MAPPSTSFDPTRPGPRGLPTGAVAKERRSPDASRSQASAPLQGRTVRPCQWPKPEAPLVGFGPLRRMSSREVRSTRASHTRHLPATGFLTLLPACSLSGPVGLFHPTNAHGVRPFRAFPLRPRWPALHRPFPLLPLPGSAEAGAGRLQGFAPGRRSVATRSGVTPPGGPDALLGFHPPQGTTGPAMGAASRPLPSRASGPKARHPRVLLRRAAAR